MACVRHFKVGKCASRAKRFSTLHDILQIKNIINANIVFNAYFVESVN